MPETTKLLLAFGADINTMNDDSASLQIVCSRNFDEVAELLLELGCDTKVKDYRSHYYTPFTMLHVTTMINLLRCYFSTVLIPMKTR